jgi:hypothetical protein
VAIFAFEKLGLQQHRIIAAEEAKSRNLL